MVFRPLPQHTTLGTALVMVCLCVWIAWGSLRNPGSWWAPDHLSRYHADIGTCSECHAPFQGPTMDKCTACHDSGKFMRTSTATVAEFHRTLISQEKGCIGCHTEHRGALSQITTAAISNPHGEFVFRATGTQSCGACHDFSGDAAQTPNLLDNRVVRELMAEGEGAHQRGHMAGCLRCHRGGRTDVGHDEED